MVKSFSLISLLVLVSLTNVYCQYAASPVSSVGIGQFNDLGLIQNKSMGGLGIGTGSYWNVNNLNPALLMYSRRTIFNGLTVFQAGMVSEQKTISNTNGEEVSNGAGMNYLITGFPIMMNKWFTTLGIQPYASSTYNLNYNIPVIGYPELTTNVFEKGTGGINTIFMSHGVNISKNISLGLTTHLLFGSREREYTNSVDISSIQNDPGDLSIAVYNATLYQRSTTNGFLFTGGIAYQDSIKIANKEPLKVTIGAIYDFKREVGGTEFESLERRSKDGSIISSDTLANSDGSVVFPGGFGMGMSLSREFKWTAGVDFGIKNYDNLLVFGEFLNTTKTYYIKSGLEYTPNAFSIDGYLKRVTYRVGTSYQKTPYLINGLEFTDFGINFGASFPIVPSTGSNSIVNKGFSSVDLGLEYGVQGNLSDNLLRESYLRFNFGVTFNDKWFVRRKFN